MKCAAASPLRFAIRHTCSLLGCAHCASLPAVSAARILELLPVQQQQPEAAPEAPVEAAEEQTPGDGGGKKKKKKKHHRNKDD